jgi:FdhE protein
VSRAVDRCIELEAQYPAAAEMLRYYREVAQASRPVQCLHHTPFCSVLRPEGEGAKRFLLCIDCLHEWEFNRIRCPRCGNEDKDTLPVYTADQFPHIRVEACDQCRTYLKAIDLTRNGLAVPEVDEIASIALDLWAEDHGYTKLHPNVLGL